MLDWRKSRKAAPANHWVAIAIGLVFGLIDARTGAQALFALNSRDSVLGLLLLMVYSFSILPGTLIGIFRPRLASHFLLASALGFIVLVLIYFGSAVSHGVAMGFDPGPLLLFFFPSVIASVLFARGAKASDQRGADALDSGRSPRRDRPAPEWSLKAKWAAIALGCFVTFVTGPMATHLARLSIRKGDWETGAALVGIAFGPLALSMLAIARVKWAAYGSLACFVVSVILIFGAWQEASVAGVLGALTELPVALMGWLLFVSEPHGRLPRHAPRQ
jgi:hypothetical protein